MRTLFSRYRTPVHSAAQIALDRRKQVYSRIIVPVIACILFGLTVLLLADGGGPIFAGGLFVIAGFWGYRVTRFIRRIGISAKQCNRAT